VGEGARLSGRPEIYNWGSMTIGERLHLGSTPVRSHLYAINGGRLVIGNRVTISYGAAIAATCELVIGDDTVIGPYVAIMDTDFHGVVDRDGPGETAPVKIGQRVRIGARVTVLRGSIIGDGATIESGSVVSGDVPAGSTVCGVPARSAVEVAGGGAVDVAGLVQSVLGLMALPGKTDGPDTLSEWDSLGALRLLLAVEDAYSVSLGEQDMKRARSIGQLEAVIDEAQRRAAHG
jgi:maltose O-acetyltransferase